MTSRWIRELSMDIPSLPDSARRRKAMTWIALEMELDDRRRTLRVRRARVAGLAIAASLALAALAAHFSGAFAPPERPQSPERIALEGRLIERVREPKMRVALEVIDDDELLDELQGSGYARGYVRLGETMWVVGR